MTVEQLGREVARHHGSGPGKERELSQRQGLLRVLAAEERRTDWRARRLLLGAVAAAAVAAGVVVVMHVRSERRREIEFWVGRSSAPAHPGQVLWAMTEPVDVRFSEGTRLQLHPHAEVAVERASREGMRVALHRGKLAAAVDRRERLSWSFVAGPYVTQITGTRLEIEWQPDRRQLQVNVETGSVRVGGPKLAAGGAVLTAGQHLEVVAEQDLPEPAADAAAATEEPGETPTLEEDHTQADKAVSKTKQRRSPTEPVWKALAVRRDYPASLAAAKEIGLDRLTLTLSAPDLILLADVARYARDAGAARQALEAVRRRFPASARAEIVPVLLGRILLDVEDKPREAAVLFEQYLRRAPTGKLAEEARGRLIEAWSRAGEAKSARQAAVAYLQHHPDGAYSRLARSLIEDP
jgi:hypothetical protein